MRARLAGFIASVFSYYDIDVEFEDGDAILWFSNGGYRVVELDDDDFGAALSPHTIGALDLTGTST